MRLLLAVVSAACLVLPGSAGPLRQIAIADEDGFFVVGYQVRTNNASEGKGRSAIGKLWQRLGDERFIQNIPHRTDNNITVVYSEYAGDETGDYSYLLGSRVSSADDLPPGMVSLRVLPGRYAIVTTKVGQMPGVLQDAWRRIWRMRPAALGGKRAFLTDYEVYDQRSVDSHHAQVDIHLGLKPASGE